MDKFYFSLMLSIIMLISSGCAVHKLQRSKKLGGYVVARFGYVIPEYTTDLEKKAPQDSDLAIKRYKRRRDTVEKYYLKMQRIESHFRRYVWHFPMVMWSLAANALKMPYHIVSEYKYDHDEEYRQKIDRLDTEEKAKEETKIKQLMEKLYEYLKEDMERENKDVVTSK